MSVATAQLQAAFPEFARTGDAGKALETWLETVLRPSIDKHIAAAAEIRDAAAKRAAEEAAAAAARGHGRVLRSSLKHEAGTTAAVAPVEMVERSSVESRPAFESGIAPRIHLAVLAAPASGIK